MEKIIVTVGPSILPKGKIKNLHKEEYIYRINGAHGSIEDIDKIIDQIREEISGAKILVDLPGNKVRTANLLTPIEVENHKTFTLKSDQVNYSKFNGHLKIGDIIWANDSTLKFEVKEVSEQELLLLSHSDGQLLNNKGLHVRGIHQSIPFLFEKDLQLIELAQKKEVAFIGLSFVRNTEDIEYAKRVIGDSIQIIPKIETLSATENLDQILSIVDVINVDRGDLSTDIGLDKIFEYQKFIIERANIYHKKVFLATQFFINMVDKPVPSIAEINDFQNCVKLGIFGIQLSEETSIGKYPEEVLNLVGRIVTNVKSEKLRYVS